MILKGSGSLIEKESDCVLYTIAFGGRPPHAYIHKSPFPHVVNKVLDVCKCSHFKRSLEIWNRIVKYKYILGVRRHAVRKNFENRITKLLFSGFTYGLSVPEKNEWRERA